ncbi:MAG: hypothetical protein Tsb0014_05390 [Pleurocapsa sp.]
MSRKLYSFSLTTLITTLITVPVVSAIATSRSDEKLIAQTPPPTPYHLVLASGFDRDTAIITGQTGGSYSLASIAIKDKNGNHCMGYSDPEPDHTMILQNNFDKLYLEVNSGGKDTTLVIKGPDNKIRCAFGQKQQRDAILSDTNWQQGQYEIWVGAMQPQQRSSYSLSVQQ